MNNKKYYYGNEKFFNKNVSENSDKINFTVQDFWHFAFGDLLDNTRRGSLAEFIVACALKLDTDTPRADWTAYDLDYNNKRIEVKASAYLQSWNLENGKLSKPSFSIAPAKTFNPVTGGYSDDYCRHSDIYIFCLFTDTDINDYNILNLSSWEFYVVPTSIIDQLFGSRKTLSIDRVRNLGTKSAYDTLKATVDNLN